MSHSSWQMKNWWSYTLVFTFASFFPWPFRCSLSRDGTINGIHKSIKRHAGLKKSKMWATLSNALRISAYWSFWHTWAPTSVHQLAIHAKSSCLSSKVNRLSSIKWELSLRRGSDWNGFRERPYATQTWWSSCGVLWPPILLLLVTNNRFWTIVPRLGGITSYSKKTIWIISRQPPCRIKMWVEEASLAIDEWLQ